MDAVSELIGKHPVDHPLALDPRGSFERRRNDFHAKVRLSLRARANMPGVQVGLINDVEQSRSKRISQLGFNRICDTHNPIHIESVPLLRVNPLHYSILASDLQRHAR